MCTNVLFTAAGLMYPPCSLTLQWLKEEFLTYLDDWEKSVQGRVGPSKEKKLNASKPSNSLGCEGVLLSQCTPLWIW